MMDIFNEFESDVRVYSRSFPIMFNKAKNEFLYDEEGNEFIDFLAGAGSLNYGHNNPVLKEALLEYISNDGITQGLDMHTRAKADFMETFKRLILDPRGLDYRMQFTGPTGANAVEAAMKLARKVKGRETIVTFTNGFHGVTLGAVSATGNQHHRGGAGVALSSIERMPYCGYHGQDADTIKMMDKLLSDPSSGVDHPAAVMVEVVQGEGGLNVAKEDWLRKLADVCKKHDMLLIVDDIQAGCGRTGKFFSFEHSGITPDIVTMSKSLSGYGLPMAVVLLKPELDVWSPGEHNGTFRGNNHAFITAAAALNAYWKDDKFVQEVERKADILRKSLKAISDKVGVTQARLKGRGLMQGLECRNSDIADSISRAAFKKGLVIETAGNRGQVVKCLVPLTISEDSLKKGLAILTECFEAVLQDQLGQVS
jgi:diaminobutyrate-2-oxoglutarate transaminase